MRQAWEDQVLREPLALRVARATNHLRLEPPDSGFTTLRDLGTEGAGYADVGLKQAIEQGIIPGPRLLVGNPGDRRHPVLRPERLRPRTGRSPKGAEEADGESTSAASSATRSAGGPTSIKVYADNGKGADIHRSRN